MVVDARRRKVDLRVQDLVNQRADGVCLRQRLKLIAKLEVFENVLDVRREAVQVVLEVGEELLLAAPGLEVAQGETRRVVERLPSGIAESGTLFRYTGPV